MARVAILIADDFEDLEYRVLVDRLRQAGDEVVVLGLKKGLTINGRRGRASALIQAAYSDFFPDQFHGLVIPGGQSTESLCGDYRAVWFVRLFFLTGRPLAALGDAVALLVSAQVASGCTLTSTPSLACDLEAVGARWVDKGVATFGDGHVVTGQGPEDAHELARTFLCCLRGTEAQTSYGPRKDAVRAKRGLAHTASGLRSATKP
jgi:protease I